MTINLAHHILGFKRSDQRMKAIFEVGSRISYTRPETKRRNGKEWLDYNTV